MSQTNVNVPGSGEGTGAGMIVGLLRQSSSSVFSSGGSC